MRERDVTNKGKERILTIRERYLATKGEDTDDKGEGYGHIWPISESTQTWKMREVEIADKGKGLRILNL